MLHFKRDTCRRGSVIRVLTKTLLQFHYRHVDSRAARPSAGLIDSSEGSHGDKVTEATEGDDRSFFLAAHNFCTSSAVQPQPEFIITAGPLFFSILRPFVLHDFFGFLFKDHADTIVHAMFSYGSVRSRFTRIAAVYTLGTS